MEHKKNIKIYKIICKYKFNFIFQNQKFIRTKSLKIIKSEYFKNDSLAEYAYLYNQKIYYLNIRNLNSNQSNFKIEEEDNSLNSQVSIYNNNFPQVKI